MKECIFNRKKKDEMLIGCNVVYSGAANYFTGFVTAGGKLILTDKELIFKGHPFNVGRRYASIPIKDISNVQIKTKICNVQHMWVTTNDEIHKFVVCHAEEWVKHIKKQD